MESKISLMRKVLTGLLEEVNEIENRIKKTGMVPKDICDFCLTTNKRYIVDFSPKERKKISLKL